MFHLAADFLDLLRVMVTFFITTSVVGLSRGPRSTPVILATSDSGAQLPKMVCLPFRYIGVPSVMKNCEPFVPGPALAIASRPGLSNLRSGEISLSKR